MIRIIILSCSLSVGCITPKGWPRYSKGDCIAYKPELLDDKEKLVLPMFDIMVYDVNKENYIIHYYSGPILAHVQETKRDQLESYIDKIIECKYSNTTKN